MKGKRHEQPNDAELLREDTLRRLFQQTGERRAPAESIRDRVRAAVHDEWRELGRRRRRRWMAPAALAAAVLLAIVLASGTFWPLKESRPGGLARVEALSEKADVLSLDGKVHDLRPGSTLHQDEVLRSGERGGLSISWRDVISIRLDVGTRVKLRGPASLELQAGRIYIDTGDDRDTPLNVVTPSGSLQHLGTQYMVNLDRQNTTVSVRSGRVLLDLPGSQVVSRGEQLEFNADGVQAFRRIQTHGQLWLWAENLAAAWQADGRTVAEFLDWVAAETGRTVEYDTAESRRLAETSRLKGEIRSGPTEALGLVLQATGLEARVDGAMIRVRKRTED